MRLFFVPGTCALIPHVTLRELAVPFTLEKVGMPDKKLANGDDYLKINPKGQVPALQLDDGEVLTEAGLIARYLSDTSGGKLFPTQGFARVRAEEWLSFFATELHKGLSPLYSPRATDDFKQWLFDQRIAPRFDFLDRHLAGRQWVLDDFSILDIYALYSARGLKSRGYELTAWPNVVALQERVAARQSVKDALAAGA
ncbi:MAG: glutathione S-transferase N-terminal domain-containing protein [Myxococcales bacterium]|nr:glutathione S-transferase N-terminal domain-containing protein [Myxococcales bacterium]